MRLFLRIFLLFLAGAAVTALGYYAYTISTSTLQFVFVGDEKQEGTIMRLAVERPRFLGLQGSGSVLDARAILSSLTRDGKTWNPTVSAEGYITVSGEYLEIGANTLQKDSTILLDADIYNTLKTTHYTLPRSVSITRTDIPTRLSITRTGLARDTTYSVEMYGYAELSPGDIRWYIHHDASHSCSVDEDWDSEVYDRINPTELSREDIGQRLRATYRLEYDPTIPYTCIVAGLRGTYTTVMDETIQPLTITGSVVSVLSPEYDLQSEVEFRFSQDIFSDTGALYSDAYMENRSIQKIEFLKLLDITPAIPITEENIIMTPNKVTVLGRFQEGLPYKIRLRGIMDTYGRTADTSIDFTPVSEPFLSLGLPSRRTMFRSGEDIMAKIYAIKTPKDVYTLKLCRVTMEGYARTERMITEGNKDDVDTIYSMLDGGVETSDCTKKDIKIEAGSSVTELRIQDMYEDAKLVPGLYVLAPRERDDAKSFGRVVLPRVFSVVDSQITMKVDASGKMQFLVTDINTGAPRSGQSLRLNKNILKTHTETWDPQAGRSTKNYLPFTNTAFATGVILGNTLQDGTFAVQKDAVTEGEYSPPYGLMYEWFGNYEGQYQSFVATAEGGGHFGYVVSTWNDGITGWNFGLKDSDYSWETRGQYLGYIHTDRKLYLRGEKVYIHAILRKNDASLVPPEGENFTVKVTNPLGVEIESRTIKANEFGTVSLDFDLDKASALGSYMVQVMSEQGDSYGIENGFSSFQVEVFKNPTFTADVKLKSSDIEGDILLNLRKRDNTDTSAPWYKDVYSSSFYIDGIVRARYYNGAEMRGIPFTYRIYRAPYYSADYWGDCFWGCYWQPSPEFYTEGEGTIDHDGVGVLRVPVEFSSFYDDYVYTAEVTIIDPLTGESIVTPSTLLARIPAEYKAFDPYNPLVFTPTQKIIESGEMFTGSLGFQYGKWDKTLRDKYQYELLQRVYTRTYVDDLRIRDTAITQSQDVVVLSGSITSSGLALSSQGLPPGEYHLRVSPISLGVETPPESSISDTLLYISGDFIDQNANLRVIPEKTVYSLGETARVLITTPFSGGYIYITRERGGVLDHEYVQLTGNSVVREYIVDDSFYPNVYIGAVAFASGYTHGMRNYAVGYGEIVTDLSDKKAGLTITTDKKIYKNREEVQLSLKMEKNGQPLLGEIAVMVVDESLIRLLGNIDLDIIPKFFRKAPFTMKTALSVIGMEKNRFLSRKGSNGGSGDKGGAGVELTSRILFKNTAYYNPTIRTTKDGVAQVKFSLPDNVTDYRIIAIGQTKSSQFAVAEDTIQVRRDYTLESHLPYITYPGDTFDAIFTVFNSTKKITDTEVSIVFGTGADVFEVKKQLIVQAIAPGSVTVSIPVHQSWRGDIPYTITVREKGTVLDSITRTIQVPDIPLLESVSRQMGVLTGSDISLALTPINSSIDLMSSYVDMRISRGFLTDPTETVRALISYPYGCIEQTISSTLPNAIALSYASRLGIDIDTDTAQKNLEDGVAKILRMQYFGGWKYWESDYESNSHVTPYVIRSLFDFRELGVEIPQLAIDNGTQYLVDRLDYGSEYPQILPDQLAEIFATLARAGHPRADSLITRLGNYPVIVNSSTQERVSLGLSRHGYLMYAFGLQYLGKLDDATMTGLGEVMNQKSTQTYWYWDNDADIALYTRLLLSRGDTTRATTVLDGLLRRVNLGSYYVSTQTKIQIFMALIEHSSISKSTKDIAIRLRSDGFIAGLSLLRGAYSDSVRIPRELTSDTLDITRQDADEPAFYELVQHDIPKDIYTEPPRSSNGMEVSRKFALVDESKGIDASGEWIVTQAVENRKFQKGKLYKVTLTVVPPISENIGYYLTLEDFMPGGWRPIRGVFDTESELTTDIKRGYWNGWTHVESQDDRILATADMVWSAEPQEYVYYIRPEYTGTYLLPPATAYYMYRPEVHAIGRYERIEVQN